MHHLKHSIIGLMVAASLVVGVPAATAPATFDGQTATGVIAHKGHKLKPGQRCNKKRMAFYHRHGFHCNKKGRLERL